MERSNNNDNDNNNKLWINKANYKWNLFGCSQNNEILLSLVLEKINIL